MGMFAKIEAKLEEMVQRASARTFRAEVQPVEIASAMRRAMDDRATGPQKGRSIVPNVFTIELSETDFERLAAYGEDLDDELVAAAEEHCDSQGYSPGGPLQIHLIEDTTLETGIFRLRPSTARAATGTSRPTSQPSVADPDDDPYAVAHDHRHPTDTAAAAQGGADSDGAHLYDADGTSGDGFADDGLDDEEDDGYDKEDDGYDVHDEGTDDPAAAAPTPRPAAPAPPPAPRRINPADRPWLEIDGERYILMGAITVLGRDESIDIILDDPGISRSHSEFRVTTDGPRTVVTVRDLRSTNGTFVNGERITSTHLDEGDRVTIGRTTAIFHAGRR